MLNTKLVNGPDENLNLSFFTKSKNLDLLLNSLGISSSNSKRVMIAGASKIGRLIARQLETEMSVRLIDNAKDKATTDNG